MPGQCYACGAEFGIFKKEHGCKNCGFAFCNKCLHEKSIPVPKRTTGKHHVCRKCYKILTDPASVEPSQPAKYDLPEAYLKRMAALKERESEEGTGGHASSSHPSQKIPAHLRKLDKADRDIAMRLEKLKEQDKPKEKVTDQDLNARLAQLKGQNFVPNQKPTYQPPDRRPQVQQVEDLLDEIAAEVAIDSHAPDPVADVEARLAHFRYGDEATKKDNKAIDRNNLNKEDNIGSGSKPYTKNIGNVYHHGAAASGGEDVNMEEMERLMAEAAIQSEADAQRALEGMQKDKELMDKLRDIQKRKEEKRNDVGGDSNTDNTKEDFDVGAAMKPHMSDSEEEDEDAVAKRIIQRYLEEAKLDEAAGVVDSETNPTKTKKKKAKNSADGELEPVDLKPPSKKELVDSDYDDSDELPYCCICTEDATLRCKDCDLDLYCQRCFRECHKEIGLTDHRTTSYKAPKGYR